MHGCEFDLKVHMGMDVDLRFRKVVGRGALILRCPCEYYHGVLLHQDLLRGVGPFDLKVYMGMGVNLRFRKVVGRGALILRCPCEHYRRVLLHRSFLWNECPP